jgi:HEPN domain-containing protein
MKRKDFQDLSRLRIKEAQRLLEAGFPEGAYYLAGYAAEFALKACIAKRTERFEFPDRDRVRRSYTHRISELVTLAELSDALKNAQAQPEFRSNWTIVIGWSEDSRYERRSRSDAEDLLRALDERKHGVLRWLRHYW